MDKEEAKENMEKIKENYKKISERVKELEEQKLRLEGQYSVYNEIVNDEKDSLKKESLEKEDE